MILLVLACSAGAEDHKTVLIQGEKSSIIEYRATLQAHPQYISPTQHLLKNRPTVEQRSRLIDDFANAQKAFLQVNLKMAESAFEQVTRQRTEADWESSDHEIFAIALFRLAQIASDSSATQDKWLSQTLHLHPKTLATVIQKLGAQIPPPLLKRQAHLSRQIPTLHLPAPVDWTEVLINGVKCSRNSCGTWAQIPEKVRVTFLSDRWQPYTTTLHLKDFNTYAAPTVAWAKGTCGDSFRQPTVFKKVKAFWSVDCDRPRQLALAVTPTPVASDELPKLEFSQKPTRIYKSKWFWAGVGLSAVAIWAVAEQNKGQIRTQPTTTYGFR